jgi:hypothetical protein
MNDRYAKPLSDQERKQLTPTLDKVDSVLDELNAELARLGRLVGDPDAESMGTSRSGSGLYLPALHGKQRAPDMQTPSLRPSLHQTRCLLTKLIREEWRLLPG